MCEHDGIFDKLAALIGGQAEQTERIATALSERSLIEDRPANARHVASDRVRFLSVYVRDDRPVELIGAAMDRARFTIMPLAGPITLGDDNVTTTSLGRCDLGTGIGLTLDTRGAVWAIAPAAAPVTVFLAVEQWDAEP